MTWNPRLHPRDPAGSPEGGEFRSIEGWAHKLLGSGGGRVRGGDASGDLDYGAARAQGRAAGPFTDGILQHIVHHQGFDGPPKVVTREEMARAEAAGWTPLFRMVGNNPQEGADQAEQYRTGPMWIGIGGYANGVYAMPEWRREHARPYGDTELHIALAPDARTIGIRELYALMEADGLVQWNRDLSENTDQVEALTDGGRYAAAHGYDAIYVPQVGKTGTEHDAALEWIILNRTATMIQEA